MSVREMAQDFDAQALIAIANAAAHRAALLRAVDNRPWRRSKEQNDAIDTFDQLAAYCKRVVEMAAA